MKFKDFDMSEESSARIMPIFAEIKGEVGNEEDIQKLDGQDIPILALRNMVLFPGVTLPIAVGRDKSLKLINEVQRTNKPIGVVCQRNSKVEDPWLNDLYEVGVVADVVKVLELGDGSTNVILQGRSVFHLDDLTEASPYLRGRISLLDEVMPFENDKEFEVIAMSLKELTFNILRNLTEGGQEMAFAIKNIDNPIYLINFLATNIPFSPTEKQNLLQERSIKKRAYKLYAILSKEAQFLELKADIQSKTREDLSQQQREHFLQQQIRTIQDELGTSEDEIAELEERAKKKKWSEETAKAFQKELRKLERINPQSPDYNVQYSYLDTLLNLPWNVFTVDKFNLKTVESKLNHDHYGLDKVKDRILEHLSVLKLRGDMKSPIICLYGPPGVGKTSLGKSVADALGRKYARVSLGGLHDEAEIRGHRRTYIGAMPGRIIDALRK